MIEAVIVEDSELARFELEHLLKAYLASLHPAHIVEEKHWESLLHATGHTSRSGVPRSRTRTIGLKTAFDRVKRLLPKITVSAQERPELPSLHEIHSGFLLHLEGPRANHAPPVRPPQSAQGEVPHNAGIHRCAVAAEQAGLSNFRVPREFSAQVCLQSRSERRPGTPNWRRRILTACRCPVSHSAVC